MGCGIGENVEVRGYAETMASVRSDKDLREKDG